MAFAGPWSFDPLVNRVLVGQERFIGHRLVARKSAKF